MSPRRVKNAEQPIVVNVGAAVPASAPSVAAIDEPAEEKPSFWERLADIPVNDWGSRCDLWLYRLEPKVRMAAGERGYLDQLAQPITPAWIKNKYGGGKFRIIVNRDNRMYMSHEEEIVGEPIFDARREVPPNGAAPASGVSPNDARVLDMLEAELQAKREELAAARASGIETPGLTQAIEVLSAAAKKGVELVGGGGNGNGTTALREAIGLLKDLGVIGNQSGGVLETVRVLKELGVIGGAVSDPMKQLNDFLSIAEKLNALRGDSEGGIPRDWKAAAATRAVELLAPIAERVVTQPPRRAPGVAQRPAPPAPPAGAVPPVPAQAVPPTARPAAPPTSQPLTVEHVGENYAEEPAASELNPAAAAPSNGERKFDESDPEFRTWVSKRIVALVTKGEEGPTVVDFLLGAGAHSLLKSLVTYTPEDVTKFMLQDPVLKLAAEHPDWPDCLHEAREYLAEIWRDTAPPPAPEPMPS